jgi:hypothetical protein
MMSEKDKKRIIELYFEEMYSIDELLQYFDYKYTESEIWSVLDTKWGD